MKRLDTRAATLAVLGVILLLVGVLTSEPAAVAFGCALFAPLLLTAALPSPQALKLHFGTARMRILEGEEIEGSLTLEAADRASWVLLQMPAVTGVTFESDSEGVAISLKPGERREIGYRMSFNRWGVRNVGAAIATNTDSIGLRAVTSCAQAQTIRVFPSPARLSRLLLPAATRPVSGGQLSRRKGDGFEFADLRPYQVGDRMRRINWKLSLRRGSLIVTERTPEESADVVLFLDAYTEARDDAGGTLDEVVRAAAALAQAHLRRRGRVGLVSFAGDLQWLRPASGQRQMYRIAETLVESEIGSSQRWQRIDAVPRRMLPTHSLVIALTPLLDERTNRALLDLRMRGYDLTVIELLPASYLARHRAALGDDAWRLWLGWREVIRARFETLGVAVATWERGQPLELIIEEAIRARRFPHARYA